MVPLLRGERGIDLAATWSHMVYAATRQYPRFPLRLPVVCESTALPGYWSVALTQNVSQGGLLLHVGRPVPPGSPVSLLMATGDRNVRADGVIVWTAEEPPCRMGVRLTTWEGGARLAWERLLTFQAGQPRRAAVRFPITLVVTCRLSREMSRPGCVENVSDTGLRIIFPQALPLNTRLSVVDPPWFILSPVEAEMQVVWTRAAPEGRGVLHGLRFCSDDIVKELFLVGLLLRHLVAQEEGAREINRAG